jgi:signal recognition particle GTPase
VLIRLQFVALYTKWSGQVLDGMLKEICGALLASDVNVQLVQRLRTNIKAAVNVQDVGAGINKKRLVQKVRSLSVRNYGPPQLYTNHF